MSAILTTKNCLVLNKNWTPVDAITLQRAIIMLFSEYSDGTPKARIIEPGTFQTFTWKDWANMAPLANDEKIAAANLFFKIPEIILLSRYEKLPKPKIHFSRRTLYKRDKYTCQFCGVQPGSEELTIDHVIPRSQGGQTSWDNCVLACVKCNRKKADKTPKQAHMTLLKEPKKPDTNFFRFDTIKPVKSWQAFLGEMYWSIGISDKDDE